jgi:nicotinate phosphoribosyltransferase
MLDNDQYKFMMQQAALKLGYANVPVEYKFKCRTPDVDLLPAQWHLNEGLAELLDLRMKSEDLDYLETMRYISPEYLSFLKNFRFERQYIYTDFVFDDGLKVPILRIKGPFFHTTLFEVPLLAIISESWSRLHEGTEDVARRLFDASIENAYVYDTNELPEDFFWADFGTRRRRSYDWHHKQVAHQAARFPKNFVGTSNVHLAREFNLKAIGTQAHEWYQLHQQLDYRLIDFQKAALENWVKVYRGDLGIALADIINTDAFLKDFNDTFFCKLFDGVREDSEPDPIEFGHKIVNFYISKHINPRTKSIIFSNNLTFEKAYKIWEALHNLIEVSFGIGTHLTNNWGTPALNIVIKMVKCNDQPVAKISNSPGKGMCESPEFVSYLKSVFQVVD